MSTYAEWIEKVDNELMDLCFMKHDDLVDQSWWDWWDAGVTPKDAAGMCISNQ